jgi:hypothetical protein
MDEDSSGSLENRIVNRQLDFKSVLDDPKVYSEIERTDTTTGPIWRATTSQKLVIPPDDEI